MSNLTKYHLSDGILDTQICTVCKKYLSYPPTKVYPTGEIKCGRCSEKNDFGVLSNFNKLTENFLFPCVNSYEGCPHWLGCSEVPQHEETCRGDLYKCPFCPDSSSKSESALNLIHHFKINHKEFILNTPILQIIREKDTTQHYFYYNLHLNLFALIFLQINNNALFVSVSTVVQKSELLEVKVKLFESYPKTVLVTSPWKACAPWNSNLDGINFNLKNELNSFCVAFEFQNRNFMIRYVTSPSKTKSLEEPKETDLPVVKTETQEKKLDTAKSNGNNILSGPNSLSESQTQTYRCNLWTENDIMPKFCLDNGPDDYLNRCLKNPIFSDCGTCIVDGKGKPVLDIQCSFCETYYVTILNCTVSRCQIKNCTYSVCGNCCSRAKNICSRHLNKLEFEFRHNLTTFKRYYFCRYSCGETLRGIRLAFHELQCKQNPFGSVGTLGTFYFLLKNFGDIISPKSCLSEANSFLLNNNDLLKERIYVIDKRGFKYYFDVKRMQSPDRFVFKIYHEYYPEKYKIIVKIFDKRLIRELHNVLNFTLDYNKNTIFAIIFREVS